MTTSWLAYLPQYVSDDLLADLKRDPLGREQRLHAVTLFADVSGFTALSEALGKSGRRGTEELTAILNSYFEPMIALIESYGGVIGKFGGDALTVLFPYLEADRAAFAAAARRAVQCALEMQAAMVHYQDIESSVGRFSLAMKAGLAAGGLLCTTAGDPEVRLEYIIAGAALDRCADAEHHAGKGEVVVHNALLAAGELVVAEQRGDFSKISALPEIPAPAPLLRPAGVPPALGEVVARYLHPIIARRIAAGQGGFIDEHRQVSIIFLSFSGFDYDGDPAVGAKLQAYLAAVVRVIARYDGYLNKVDMGDKGSKYIVLFGAPVAHEDDEVRAVRCAMELVALPGATARAGVNTGFVFCGQVGSAARREYTVMGDPVNLAARLMQAARPDQVLAGAETRMRTGAGVSWEALEPIMVKGKSAPIAIYAARGVQESSSLELLEPAIGLPLVGRLAELARIEGLIERSARGEGQVLAITGEAGMGKSRLAAELIRRARERGFRGYGGACQSYGTGSSYLVWRTIWRESFQLDPQASPAVQGEQLERVLAAVAPQLGRRGPLLGPLLNLAIPDNELTAPLDPQLRDQLRKALLLEYLRYAGRNGPLLLVLDDCHWIDPASQDLLVYLGRNLAELPVLLLALYRPPDTTPDPLGPLQGQAHVNSIQLDDLTPEAALQLARLKLAQRFASDDALPAVLIDRLVERAQGNPFYLEELINLVHDRSLAGEDLQSSAALELPDSLQSLILSRIDRLDADEQAVLKTASVIGRHFRASWLPGAAPELGRLDQVIGHLQMLSRLDLTPLERTDPEPEYLFRHALTQEVAYASLAYAGREALHEQVAAYVEHEYEAEVEAYLDILAYHYGRSRNSARQRYYFRRAGDQAAAVYANQAALDYYQRLLPLLPEHECSEVLCDMAEIWRLTGAWAAGEEAARRALALAEAAGDMHGVATARRLIGALVARTTSYAAALPWLEQARTDFSRIGDLAGLSRTLELLSFANYQQGDNEQALSLAQEQLQVATACADQRGRSDALAQIGSIHARRGALDAALEANRQALAIAQASGYRRREALARSEIARVFWQRGDYPAALSSLLEGLAIADEIGYRWVTGMLTGNAGLVYEYLGDYRQARACYAAAFAVALELGDGTGVLRALSNLALVDAAAGDGAAAARPGARALAMARDLDMPEDLCPLLLLHARLETAQGRYETALASTEEALAIAERSELHEEGLKAQTLLLRLRCTLGTLTAGEAIHILESLLAGNDDIRTRADLAYAIQQIDPTHDEARRRAADYYRQAYAQAPEAECRQRYAELTGEQLPAPPALPPLPPQFLVQAAGQAAVV